VSGVLPLLAPSVLPPVVLAAAAAALWCPWRASAGRAGRVVERVRGAPPGRGLVLVGAAGLAFGVPGLVVLLDGNRLLLALLLVATAAATTRQVRAARVARAADRRRGQVVELCEALVGELRAGLPPAAGLEHCRDVWPEIDPVAGAARLGASVPAALHRLARVPGAEGLHEVAAAWQVSERSGAGLAGVLGQVAETARERQATRHVVQGELASAQATARLVALLPLASLGMSTGIGGHPWHFLLATTAGVGCLGCSVALAFAGLAWIDRIATAVLRT
jgi:tight adherence protein B